MIPKDKVEFVVARFTYVSHFHPQYPVCTLTRKKHSPSGSMTIARDWFDRTISAERAKLPRNTAVRFAEYRILSGDSELFTVDGHRFDKILLVLGEELAYWTFYQTLPLHRRIEGKAVLPLAYCVCCFDNQYPKVMAAVKLAAGRSKVF